MRGVPHLAHRNPPRIFFLATAICKVQLILRSGGAEFFQSTTTTITPAINADAISWIKAKQDFRHQPHLAHRSPPCKFCDCNLQGAIDFAEAAYPRKAWQALHISLILSKLSDANPT